MIWILVLIVYTAPADAVNWDGPWKAGVARVMDGQYLSEEQCKKDATEMIADLHKKMLAPMRYRCLELDAALPKGAPR